MSNHTPTPVPSEVAETTAGEREVEALADLSAIIRDFLMDEGVTHAGYCATALTHRIGPLLDRVRREEGAKVLREAADTFAWAGDDEDYRAFRDWLRARAGSVGRGEGL